MNYNILGYIIYLAVTGFIILRVGWLFYHYGAVYLYDIFPEAIHQANALNKLLLIGYYLLNLGYMAWSLSLWPTIESIQILFEVISEKIGLICLILGAIHFMNMGWVRLLKKQISSINI